MSNHKAKRILPMSKRARASHRRKVFLLQPLAETVFSSIFQNIQSLREYTQSFFMTHYTSEMFMSHLLF